MTLYMKVTKDKYELPVAVADSKAELADMLGVGRTSVYRALKRREGKSVYIAVEVEDVERHERRTGS